MKGIYIVINTVYCDMPEHAIKLFDPLDPRSNSDKNVIVFLYGLCAPLKDFIHFGKL